MATLYTNQHAAHDAASYPAATITIGTRFSGPPGMGNGGYVAGRLAAYAGNPAEVTLHRPIPMGQPITVTYTDAGVALAGRDGLLALARPGEVDVTLPDPLTFAEAGAVSRRFRDTLVRDHPFPACFVCGPERADDDGLGIFPGPLETGLVAAPWVPDLSLAGADGLVRPEFVWAALDCPGGCAIIHDRPRPIVLGRITADLRQSLEPGERYVVVGWRLGGEGRKHHAGTAIFTEDGDLCGYARSVWFDVQF